MTTATKVWQVGVDRSLPIGNDVAWDGGKAKVAIFKWATGADGKIDVAKAKRCFLIYDPAHADTQAGYKLPIAMIGDDGPHIVAAALRNALARIATMTGVPRDVKSRARSTGEAILGKANNSKKATVKDNGHVIAVNALNEAAQIMATLHLNSGAIINQPLERAAGTLRRAALNDGTLPGSIQREMRDLANKIENANPKTVSGLRDQVVTLRMRLSHSKAVTIKATPALLLSDSALRDLKQGGAAMLKIAAAQLNQAAVAATEAQARPLFEQAARLLYQGQNSPQVIQLIKRGQIAEQGGASQMAKATRIVRKAKALGARKAGSADQVLTQLKTIQSEMTAPYWAENALNISLTANRAHQAGSRAGSDVPPRVLAQIATIEKYLREMAKMNTMEQRTATGNAILNQVRSAIAELSE